MKILVFTEGTVLMHKAAVNLSREERVKQSQAAGIQREERQLAYESNSLFPPVAPGSVYDWQTCVPVGNCVAKLKAWKKQGHTILYLTSRRIKAEVEMIKAALAKYDFPDAANLYWRSPSEDYKDVAVRLLPDVIVEDDCESIGGETEMTYPHLSPEIKQKIKSVVVPEFGGIDHLPDSFPV